MFSWKKKWNVFSSNSVPLTCHGCRLRTAVKGRIAERKAKPLIMEKRTPGTDVGLQSLAHISLHTCSSTSHEKWAKYMMTNNVSMPAIIFLIKIMDNFKHQKRDISPCPTMILTSARNGFKSSRVQKQSLLSLPQGGSGQPCFPVEIFTTFVLSNANEKQVHNARCRDFFWTSTNFLVLFYTSEAEAVSTGSGFIWTMVDGVVSEPRSFSHHGRAPWGTGDDKSMAPKNSADSTFTTLHLGYIFQYRALGLASRQ